MRCKVTKGFDTIVGVVQGRVLSPLHFNVFPKVVTAEIIPDKDDEMKVGAIALVAYDLRT